MTKKEYLQPTITVTEIELRAQILGGSVKNLVATGLDDDLEKDDASGDSWGDAMSRRRNRNVWDDEEEDW